MFLLYKHYSLFHLCRQFSFCERVAQCDASLRSSVVLRVIEQLSPAVKIHARSTIQHSVDTGLCGGVNYSPLDNATHNILALPIV